MLGYFDVDIILSKIHALKGKMVQNVKKRFSSAWVIILSI